MRVLISTAWLFLSMLLAANYTHAAVSASVNKAVIKPGESVTLIYESNKPVTVNPDFSVIKKYFDITSQKKKDSYRAVNGKRVQVTRWTLELKAKKLGEMIIPRIKFGKQKSPEVIIKVAKRLHDVRFFVRVELKPKQVYVQQHAIITYKLYIEQKYKRSMNYSSRSNRKISIPKILHGDALFYSLTPNGVKGVPETFNGMVYNVFHYPFVVVPVRPGKLELRSPITEVTLLPPIGSARPRFVQKIDVDDTVLKILGKPKNFKGKHWLPAQGLRLLEDWSQDPANMKVGEPVTRTIEIQAQGLSKDQLPKLDFGQINGAKQYYDKPKLENKLQRDSVVGTRREIISFIPTKAGKLEVPEIKLVWWNTHSKKLMTATIPKRVINVQPNAGAASLPSTHVKPPKSAQTDKPEGKKAAKPDPGLGSNIWFWVTLILVIVWVATVALLMLKRKPQQGMDGKKQAEKDKAKARDVTQIAAGAEQFDQRSWSDESHWLKTLRSHARANKAHDCRSALLHWGRCHWPQQPPHSIREIANRMGHEELLAEVRYLDQCLYDHDEADDSSREVDWDGRNFVTVFDQAHGELVQAETVKQDEVLVPLYLKLKSTK